MGIREKKAIATRKAILDATTELVNEKGYEHVSVEDITKRAGIAKGTFYNYFKQKDDVITEFSNSHFAGLNQEIGDIVADKDAIAGVAFYLKNFVEFIYQAGVSQNRQWIRYIIIPSSIKNKWDYDVEHVEELLASYVKKGELAADTPVGLLANRIMTYIHGAMFTWAIDDQKQDFMGKTKDFCQHILPLMMKEYLTGQA